MFESLFEAESFGEFFTSHDEDSNSDFLDSLLDALDGDSSSTTFETDLNDEEELSTPTAGAKVVSLAGAEVNTIDAETIEFDQNPTTIALGGLVTSETIDATEVIGLEAPTDALNTTIPIALESDGGQFALAA